jgi:hypothetical protein
MAPKIETKLAALHLGEEEEEGEIEGVYESVSKGTTHGVDKIVDELSLLSLAEMEEVKDALAVLIRNKKKPLPKGYVNWCEERDKWLGMPKPEIFADKVGVLGEDVPTRHQWNNWNNPGFATYKGDRWSLVRGVPVRKGKE